MKTAKPTVIRVAIVEDDPGVRAGWISILNGLAGYRCTGDFGSGEEALEKLPQCPPDFVLMDINLPGISGVECTRLLKQQLPQVEVLMLTMFSDRDWIFDALRAGACGYLLKRTTPSALKAALDQTLAGGAPMSPQIARQVVRFFQETTQPAALRMETTDALSPQETETLSLLTEGCQYKEIADRLGISLDTVRTYIRRIYKKLHVHSRTEAVVKHHLHHSYLVRRPRALVDAGFTPPRRMTSPHDPQRPMTFPPAPVDWEITPRLSAFPMFLKKLLLFLLTAVPAAAVEDLPLLHPIFDSHMVFPRDVEAPVWGWSRPGETVTLSVKDPKSRPLLTKSTKAGPDGRWEVAVGPFPASDKGIGMVVSCEGQPPRVLTDVLVGDVWLCSGQSNMARSLAFHNGIPDIPNQDEEIADTIHYPLIRQYYVGNSATSTPQLVPTSLVTDETGSSGPWLVNNPDNAARPSRYTAVGYFFGRQLHRTLKVPIGIVQMSWGGTSIEGWIDPVTLSQNPDFPNAATLPDKPGTKTGGAIYNGKVATLIPFKFKGVVWYQGESNEVRPEQYRTLLPQLFKSWRQAFRQPALPFVVIQLPNYQNDNWAILRDAQLNAVRNDRHSRLVVTIDLADPKELHPADKQDVGIRAARAALGVAYGHKLAASGPLPNRAMTKGALVRCEFTEVGDGLMVGKREIPPTKPGIPTTEVVRGTLIGFEIAADDGKFYPATAVISGRATVDVSCPEVTAPVSVRYAWAGNPECNLYNRILDAKGKAADGLPASPFSIPAVKRP